MTEPNAYDDTDLLNYAIQTGIISLNTMLNDIADMERKEILAQHVYAITVTTDKSGKEIYSTYLPQQDRNRLYRRRNTREELENVIVEFYKALQEEIYIDDVFYEWINRKLDFGEIQKASYDRYVNDYKRFFHYTSVSKRNLKMSQKMIWKYLSNAPFVTLHLPERHMPDYGH